MALIETPQDWCDFYGVKVSRGVATLYKSVHPDFYSPHNRKICYAPGSKPKAPDWDGGKNECGGGLHFSPTVSSARTFHSSDDARYVECRVRLTDMAIHPDGEYPEKCKAAAVCLPIHEVDIDGKRKKGGHSHAQKAD